MAEAAEEVPLTAEAEMPEKMAQAHGLMTKPQILLIFMAAAAETEELLNPHRRQRLMDLLEMEEMEAVVAAELEDSIIPEAEAAVNMFALFIRRQQDKAAQALPAEPELPVVSFCITASR